MFGGELGNIHTAPILIQVNSLSTNVFIPSDMSRITPSVIKYYNSSVFAFSALSDVGVCLHNLKVGSRGV